MTILLAVKPELHPDWESMAAPPKMGNLKDPVKIEAKMAEWRDQAQQQCLLDPLTSVTGEWVVATDISTDSGSGAESLVEKLLSLSGIITTVGAKTTMKRLSFEMMKAGKYEVPRDWFHFPHERENTHVRDPLRMLKSGMSEFMNSDRILSYFGFPTELYMMPAIEQLNYLSKMAEMVGLRQLQTA